jgi:hypothetical protein
VIAAERRSPVYDGLVRITDSYLGPASRRFINRQIENHLHKEPYELTKQDLESLIDWIQVVVALTTDDEHVIEEYISQVKLLTAGKNKSKKEFV